ncbi:MAG: thiamine pyrophosphate-binding protein, partial [Betaproteobacteria bacterium]|nr:thiamine pyrophosphate-binding protein [Betaproteobacteria bacterium]
MPKMSAGRAVIESLHAEEVRYVYGIVGSCMIEIIDELHDRQDIAWIGTRHEQGAAHMADGYARVFQEIDQVAMFKPLTKWSAQAPRADMIPELFRHAFRVATSGKKGPVHVDLPRDILNEEIDVEMPPPARYRDERAGPAHPEAVSAAAAALLRARRPVIVAGLGVGDSNARAELLELAGMLSAAVVTSYSRNDVVPAEHPLVVGPIGRAGAPEARASLQGADLVLAAGTR